MRDKKSIARHISIFAILLLITCIVVVFFRSNNSDGFFDDEINELKDGWLVNYTDQSGADIELSNVSLPYTTNNYADNNGFTITRRLPDSIASGDCLYVFGMNQEVDVYIDGELRKTNHDAPELYGNLEPSEYIALTISDDDAGKAVSIEYNSVEPEYRGYAGSVYLGSHVQFSSFMIDKYGIDMLFGVVFLFISMMWFIVYISLRILFKRDTDLSYLGYFSILMGCWGLLSSMGRQVYISDIFCAEKLSAVILGILAIPVLQFIDARQKHRHIIFVYVNCTVLFLTTVVLFHLDFFGIISGVTVNALTRVVLLTSIILSVVLVIYDSIKNKKQSNKDMITAMLILAVAVVPRIIGDLVMPAGTMMSNMLIYLAGILISLLLGIGNIKTWAQIEREAREASHASKAKSDFLANMSHEIRTPINAVLGMNEMILREAGNDNVRTYANKIKNAGNVLLSIVNNILDYSKIESGKMELNLNEYETVPLFVDVINMNKAKAEEKGLEFIVDIDNSIPVSLYGDDMRLRQIITNILNNAVKYTRKGSVTIAVKRKMIVKDNIILAIEVTDTGIGIKEEDLPKLYESFTRLDEKHNKTVEGTGLGMSITTHFLKMMGSELQVESEYGNGSKFWFELEQRIVNGKHIEDFAKASKVYESRESQEHTGIIAPDAKVLVVDDNEMNLEVIKGLLKETKLQVTTADRGPRALELIRNFKYHLVLMDHMMPGMDGIETLQHIREYEKQNGITKPVPVVALTANAIAGAKEMYVEKGFQDYLVKPIVINDLVRVLGNFIPAKLITRVKDASEYSKDASANEVVVGAGKSAEYYLNEYGINIQDGIKFSAGKPSKYKMMLGVYAKFDAGRREKLSQLVKDKNMSDYAIEVHALKSNARGIGANNLADIAYAHEKKSKEKDYEYVSGNFDLLLEEMDQTFKGVDAIINDPSVLADNKDNTKQKDAKVATKTEPSDVKSESKSSVVSYKEIDRLCELTGEYDRKEAISLIDKWLGSTEDKNYSEQLNKIKEDLQEFEFEKAISESIKLRDNIKGDL